MSRLMDTAPDDVAAGPPTTFADLKQRCHVLHLLGGPPGLDEATAASARCADPRAAAFRRALARLVRQGAGVWWRSPLAAAIAALGRLDDRPRARVADLLRPPSRSRRPRETPPEALLWHSWAAERWLFAAGGREAGKLEIARPQHARGGLRALRRRFEHVLPIPASSGGVDLLYGHARAPVERLAAVTRAMYSARDHERATFVREAGALLGYPRCCVEAYCDERLFKVAHTHLAWLWRRYRHDGAAPPEASPFWRGPVHLPCALDCPATLAQVRGIDAAEPPARRRALSRLRGLPTLYLLPLDLAHERYLDGPDALSFAALEPTAEPTDGGFAYRVAAAHGSDRRLAAVRAADRITIGGGRARLARGAAHRRTLCAEAVLWRADGAVDAAFWRPFLARLIGRHAAR